MQLSEWLTSKGLTAAELARRIDRSSSTVSRILRGEVVASRETIRRIVAETNGEVDVKGVLAGVSVSTTSRKNGAVGKLG